MGKDSQIVFMGDSLKLLRGFPDDVKDEIGQALRMAQRGLKHDSAKPYSSVTKGMEVVSNHDGDTWRGVYTLAFEGWVYVLDCFQKKSHKGKRVPKEGAQRVQLRFRAATRLHKELGR